MIRTSLAIFVLLVAPLSAESSSALPGCKPRPEIAKIIHEQLGSNEFDKLSFADQVARRRKVLSELIASYPREIDPQKRLISATRYWEDSVQPGSFASLQEHYRQQVKEHPEDPLTLDLAANALIGTDTAEAIRLLEAAKAEAPQFVWPDLDLADIYTSGKFADKQKFTDHLTAFWIASPGATDSMARWLLVKDISPVEIWLLF